MSCSHINREKIIKVILEGTSVLVVALTLTLVSNFIFKKTSNEEQKPAAKVVTTYEEKDTLNKVLVAQGYRNTTINGQPDRNFKKVVSSIGTIDHGYLYIKASADSRPLNSDEDVYVKLQNNRTKQQIGGHLLLDKSLPTAKEKSTTYTEYLYDLSDVKYKLNTQKVGYETLSGDWTKMLNENQ